MCTESWMIWNFVLKTYPVAVPSVHRNAGLSQRVGGPGPVLEPGLGVWWQTQPGSDSAVVGPSGRFTDLTPDTSQKSKVQISWFLHLYNLTWGFSSVWLYFPASRIVRFWSNITSYWMEKNSPAWLRSAGSSEWTWRSCGRNLNSCQVFFKLTIRYYCILIFCGLKYAFYFVFIG